MSDPREQYPSSETPPDVSKAPRATLVIRNGGFEGMSYDLGSEETLIGRNPTTDITLLDEGISREHALISYDATSQTHTIEDLQSTNGTKLNGKKIRSAVLTNGDEIQVGHTLFQFLLR
jgi:pSer/pThr/pTyr-binding forkhead associated (FHA) protein